MYGAAVSRRVKSSALLKLVDPVLVAVLGAIMILGWVLAVVRNDAAWAVAAATIVLAVAAIMQGRSSTALSRQTEVLAEATRELTRIEERQDLRTRLGAAIEAADGVRAIDAEGFFLMLQVGNVKEDFAQRVFRLARYADLISDASVVRVLKQWRDWFDAHRRGVGDSGLGPEMAKMREEFEDLQRRLSSEITAWRDRLTSA